MLLLNLAGDFLIGGGAAIGCLVHSLLVGRALDPSNTCKPSLYFALGMCTNVRGYEK